MKRKIGSLLILTIFILLSCATLVNAKTKYEIKEIPEISKYSPYALWISDDGKSMEFYGIEYACDKEVLCNMYSYDFKGNVTKLNEYGGFGDRAYPTDGLFIKEKQGDDYLVETCHFDADGKEVGCKIVENLKVRKLILSGLGTYIIEIYNTESKNIEYFIYDRVGNETLKLSSDLELIIPYEKNEDSDFSEAEFWVDYDSYAGEANVIIFKNTKTNNYHVVGYNEKEEIITLDVLKEYGLNADSVLDLQISLSDDKNIYHVDDKIFGDSKGLFSSKQYQSAYASKLGNEYVIIDVVDSDKTSFKDSYYNNWYNHYNVYSIDGKALVNENEYLFVDEAAMIDGLIVMYNKQGKVIVRDNKSILLEKDTGLKEVIDFSNRSIIHNGNIYFILATPDEYGNEEKGYAYVLEVTDDAKKEETKEETTKEYTYKFLTGIKVTFKIDSKNHVTFTIDGDFNLFKEIYIDGKLLDAKNYTVKEGSTIVTLKDDYAKKLADGKEHTIKVVYTNGKEASTTFKVEEKIENPHTGQAISIMFIVSLIGIAAFIKSKKKSDVLKKI